MPGGHTPKMRSAAEIRARVDQVTSFPVAERERIYRKYFARPSATVQYLCQVWKLDTKRVLDVGCHYGYHMIYFGDDSQGIDGSPQYLQFAREIGLNVQEGNIEDGLPEFDEPFDAVFFSGTLEEILSPHVMLMRFRKVLKPDGLLCLRVPTVPPRWFDRLFRLWMPPGYDATHHIYFFTPRLLGLTVKRAGYDVLEMVSTGVWVKPWLRPLHRFALPLTPAATIIAQPRADFVYPSSRAIRFLATWAADLGPYHQDYQAKS
jgi:SAM-dependent methyltransferase